MDYFSKFSQNSPILTKIFSFEKIWKKNPSFSHEFCQCVFIMSFMNVIKLETTPDQE